MNRQVKAYYDLAFDYHIAATTLWTQIMDCPYLYNPVTYLLRHTIELQLKGLILYEAKKSNKTIKVQDVTISSNDGSGKDKRLDSIHSLLMLWEGFKGLRQNNKIQLDPKTRVQIDKVIKKIDKKDFFSTRYRYPFNKKGSARNIEPVDISFDDKAPDLALGIPCFIQAPETDRIGIVNKGVKLLQETQDLFDVVEDLFSLFEH